MSPKANAKLGLFTGQYEHGLDEKGRVILPARFRERLGKKAVLARGLDDCLDIYPLADWMAYLETHVLSLDPLNSDARALARRLTASAQEVEVDKQGRVLIPPILREQAGLGEHVILVGVWDRIELWSKERWAAQAQKGEEAIRRLDEIRTLARPDARPIE